MAGVFDFLPLFERDATAIRADVDADVNAGLDPSDARWVDTSEGGFYWDMTQPVILEIERLWDALATVVPAVGLVEFAYGEYLDAHGSVFDVPRKDAAAATGTERFTGAVGTEIATGTQIGTTRSDPDDDPVTYQTTASGTIPAGGSLDLPIEAVEAGSEGNVAADTVTVLLTPLAGITGVTNPAAVSGGADVESDEAYRDRLVLELSAPQGAGNVSDYLRWALAYPGVGFATVQPAFSGPNTVRVIVTDENNDPVSSTVTDGLQAQLDPVPGEGRGLAPVGATVTVATPTTHTVDVTATVTFKTGYSLDGAAGTIATEADLETAIRDYIDHLEPGEAVVKQHVEAQFFRVEGVLSVSVSAPAADVAIGSLEVARTGLVSLS